MTSPEVSFALNELARLYGVQTAYLDACNRERPAACESLLAVLRSLGAPVTTVESAPDAVRAWRTAEWSKPVQPVAVAWDGLGLALELRLPSNIDTAIPGKLVLENGEESFFDWRTGDLATLSSAEVEGRSYTVRSISLPDPLPFGYHRLTLELQGKTRETTIISAPMRAYHFPDDEDRYDWGLFAPLYALRSRESTGYTNLSKLIDWTGSLGGRVVQCLPLLPVFTEGPVIDPSPYLPVSRLLWNEFYIHLEAVPELARCAQARAVMASPVFVARARELQAESFVEYAEEAKLRRIVLYELAQFLKDENGPRCQEFNDFLTLNPAVGDYARFRAAGEKFKTGWPAWPSAPRSGALSDGDCDLDVQLYYAYCQWLAHQQVQAVSAKARDAGRALYLDLPVGVHPDGFDTWRYPGLFLGGLTAGAPPDPVFTTGQDWAFPPINPAKIRETGYQYVKDYLAHNLASCQMLRVDHVMGLHRLFVIPAGMKPEHGVYLEYPANELYALLTLESHRSRTVIVGEDLGIVPPYVRPAMEQHGFETMWVMHFQLKSGAGLKGRRDQCASLNTHDMPPFAAFWEGLDIDHWLRIGIINKEEANNAHIQRTELKTILLKYIAEYTDARVRDAAGALRACLALLANTEARTVMVSLEDLWGETEPQNIPGTCRQYPNWRRRARYAIEEFTQMPAVLETLGLVNEVRNRRHTWSEKQKLITRLTST